MADPSTRSEKPAGSSDSLPVDTAPANPASSLSPSARALLEALGGHLSDTVWLADAHSATLHYISPAVEAVWGQPAAELTAQPDSWTASLSPDDRTALHNALTAMAERGESAELTVRITTPDHRTRSIRLKLIQAVELAEGTGVVGIAQPATPSYPHSNRWTGIETRLRFAERLANLGSWEFDLDAGRVYASEMARQIYGVGRDEELTLADMQRVPLPEERPRLDEALDALLDRGEPYEIMFRIKRRNDGAVRVVRSVADVDPETGRVIGTLQDITSDLEREAALRQSSELFDVLTQQASDYILLLQHERIVYANQALLNELGGEEDLYGEQGFLRLVAPDERDRILRYHQQRVAGDEDLPSSYETMLQTSSGRRIPVEARARRVFYHGEPAALAIIRNQSDRVEAERQMRMSQQIIQSIPLGLHIYDREGEDDLRLVAVNPSADQFTGIDADEVVGKTMIEAFPGLKGTGLLEQYLNVLDTGEVLDLGEFQYAAEKGSGGYRVLAFPVSDTRLVVSFDDITFQMLTQEQVRESEERLRLFMDASMDGITIWDADERLVTMNKAAENILPDGMNRERALGRTHRELTGLDYSPIVQRALQTGRQQREIAVFPCPGQGDRVFDTRAFPVGDGVGILGLDVTDQVAQQRALEDSEERMRLFMNSATDSFTLWDSELRLIDYNLASAAFLPAGMTREDVIGKTYGDIVEPTLEDISREVLRSGEPWSGREEITLPGGSRRVMHLQLFPVGEGLGVIASDLTERERAQHQLEASEAKYRALSESVSDALYIMEVHENGVPGRMLQVNDVACKMLGYTREELLGKGIPDINHPEQGIDSTPYLQRMLTGDAVLFEQVHQHKDGHAIPVEVNASMVNISGSTLLIGTVRDISDRKAAEESLKRSERRFRLLFDNMIDAVFVHKFTDKIEDSRILLSNDVACQRYGYTRSQLTELTVGDIGDPQNLSRPLDEVMLDLMDGAFVEFQSNHRPRTGKPFPVEVRASVIEFEGAPAVISICRDITDRLRDEQRLQRTLADLHLAQRMASIGNWTLDPEVGVPEWSDEVFRIYERDPADGPLPLADYPSVYSGQDLETFQSAVRRAVEQGTPCDIELHPHLPGGISKHVRAICEPEPDRGPAGHRLRGTIQDITEIRRTERELETIFDLSLALLCVADMDTVTFTRVNPAFRTVLGYESDELLSRPFVDFLHPDDVDPTMTQVQNKLQQGERVFSFDNRYRHQDGSYRWIKWSAAPDLDEGNLIAVGVDITLRKEAEERLRVRSEFDRLLLDFSAHFINLPSEQVNAEINAALARIGAFKQVERAYVFLYDESLNTMTNTHEWCADGVPSEMDRMQGVPADLLPWFNEKMTARDVVQVDRVADLPEEAHIERDEFEAQEIQSLVCVPMSSAGKLLGFLGFDAVAREIAWSDDTVSQLKIVADILASALDRTRTDSEMRRLAQAIEQSAESIVITDRTGRIEYVNRAFEQSTGYSRAEAIGQNPRVLKSGKHDTEFYKAMWDTLSRGEIWRGKVINRRKDGTLYTESAVISPLRDEHGETVSYIAAKQDITQQLQLEEQLRQAHKMEAVGNLAGGIAHDFNNMLTVITGNVDLLLMTLTEQNELRREIEEIGQTAERAADLTRQLLSFSRKQVVRPKVLQLTEAVQQSERLLRRAVGEHIDLRLSLDSSGWRVRIDPVQLDQILINLVVNARDAMPRGGMIRIRTAGVDQHTMLALNEQDMQLADHVRIDVVDTGTGMDAATVDRIFEPFFTTKDTGKGTGLGLAAVYGIVKQSGGFLRVDSELGKGTTFSVYLPRVDDESTQTAEQRPDDTHLRGKESVLIVEDDPMVRRSAVRSLELFGYDVREAPAADEALEMIQRGETPDLIVTDVVMPRMSGGEFVRRLNEIECPSRVIYMSGYPADSAATEGVLKGAHYIQKPFRIRAFVEFVRKVLDDTI